MSRFRVVFRREALEQLEALYDFIADTGSPENAAGFAESIVVFCEGLGDFHHRGTSRDDLRPGLRPSASGQRVSDWCPTGSTVVTILCLSGTVRTLIGNETGGLPLHRVIP